MAGSFLMGNADIAPDLRDGSLRACGDEASPLPHCKIHEWAHFWASPQRTFCVNCDSYSLTERNSAAPMRF